MKYLQLLVLLIVGNISLGQTGAHVTIPGTKCSVIPPEGFELATSFSGLQHQESGSSIMVNKIPNAPYQTLADGFNAENLKTKGMLLISKQAIDFKGKEATLLKVSQKANGTTYYKDILMFGTSEATVMVNGIYPEEYKSKAEEIKESVLSTIYDVAQNDNPLDAVTFRVDTDGTEFKFTKFVSGMLCFTTDGKLPTDKPTLFVGKSISKINTSDKKLYAEERLKQLPGRESVIIKEVKELSIDNMSGYELLAEGKTAENKTLLTYQTMLFNSEGDYYIITGQAEENLEDNLKAFRKITESFKRK